MLDGVVEVLEARRTAPIGDRGIIVSSVSWVMLVATIFTLLTRLAMKLALSKKEHKFGLDDVFIILAALFSIGQTASVSVEAMNVLGQHFGDLTAGQKKIFQKAEYAGCMLYIANMGCARISVCLLIKQILPGRTPKITALVFAVFSFIWSVSGVIVTAFPCHLPKPWDFSSGKCYNIVKFVNYLGITNCVFEVLLVMIPLFVWNLRLTAGRRVSVSFVFLTRLSIVAVVITQLVFFNRYCKSPDITYSYWRTILCIQIAQNLSIITACLPCLHPFILGILAGTTQTECFAFQCKTRSHFQDYFRRKSFKLDSQRSSTSPTPMREESYCAPLATYGLDRSSAHLNSQHFNRFPTNVATPIVGNNPPENIFNRSIEIPRSRPGTSASQIGLPAVPPKTLSQVGVLPIIDWDTDSSDRDSGRSSPSRRPNSDYVFNREKVISVPEAGKLYEEDYWRRYPPPPEK
ncbi:uncharacterized protein BDR25DRAFT_312921 [Lindgomyces ingoldianus]|uniref:Uncharacterized protein n=1 Tax=Lindgomyces ingoldianus TaxID=673940 RepID=A0ACB6QZB0_9PLEO|nr:uncharacterized protein BDR25DRAFT_312921 [Lindgomyces ingoldianus]KAF2472368.1 hypothetical protein BDR25DRAFT_312921 [Lindgomyces ingoldianus]